MKRFMINRLYAAYKALKEPESYLSKAGLAMIPGLAMKACRTEGIRIGTHYGFECVRADGSLRWADGFDNIVTDVGMDHILHKMFNIDTAMPAMNTNSSVQGDETSTYGGRRVPTAWLASQLYKIGDVVRPGDGKHNGYFYICTTAGTSNNTEGEANSGAWPTGIGGTITETDGVVWHRADWYIGLISGSGSPTVANTDRMDSHGTWSEEHTNYSETIRRPFDPNTSTANEDTGNQGRILTNSTAVASFSMTGAGTLVEGAFMTNLPTKNSAVGLLYGAGTFAERTTQIGDTLNVTVTLRIGTV